MTFVQLTANERQRLPAIYHAIEHVGKQFPTIRDYQRDLTDHDAYSGSHVMGVTITMVDAAIRLGLSPTRAALFAVAHDSGKRDVSKDLLQSTSRLTDEQLTLVRLPHMDGTRARILDTPDKELPHRLKHMTLQTVMAHHELYTNGDHADPYPRRRMFGSHPERMHMPPAINTWKHLLAWADKADRFHRGFITKDTNALALVEEKLLHLTPTADLPFSRPIYERCIRLVTRSTGLVTDETVSGAMRAMQIRY